MRADDPGAVVYVAERVASGARGTLDGAAASPGDGAAAGIAAGGICRTAIKRKTAGSDRPGTANYHAVAGGSVERSSGGQVVVSGGVDAAPPFTAGIAKFSPDR